MYKSYVKKDKFVKNNFILLFLTHKIILLYNYYIVNTIINYLFFKSKKL